MYMGNTTDIKAEEIGQHYVDLHKILGDKNVRVPYFVERWLGKLLHVDQINDTIYRNRHLFGLDFVYAFIEGEEPWNLGMKITVRGLERLPEDGCPMVVGNHPLGGPDGLALMDAVGRRRQDIVFPVTDFLLYLPGLRSLFVPINKVSRSKSMAGLEEAFAGDNVLLYYPSGAASRRRKGIIRDLEWHPTVVKKAVRYHRDIVPVYTEARNRGIFYRVANLRRRLGIKFSFEMAMLPAEMFAQRGKHITITFGAPIPWQTFDQSHTATEWASLLRDHVYKLKGNPDALFTHHS